MRKLVYSSRVKANGVGLFIYQIFDKFVVRKGSGPDKDCMYCTKIDLPIVDGIRSSDKESSDLLTM